MRCVVTGAGHGLGRGLALSLAELGSKVAAVDIDGQAAERTAHEVRERGATGVAYRLDVTDDEAVERTFARCTSDLGRVDLLVNNAAVLSVSPVIDLDPVEWRRVMEVNATGTFLCSRAAARLMVADGAGGSIVSIASVSGKVGDPGLAHYSASKFAVIGLTQSLARELAASGVTVNAVCPGLIATSMIDAVAQEWGTTVEQLAGLQAVTRPQTAEEIAMAVSFLHRNRSVTGQAVNVDGGAVFH